MNKRITHHNIFTYLHQFSKVYNAGIQQLQKCLSQWSSDMVKKRKPAPKPTRRKRVTFYIKPKGSKKRKKITFLASP